MSKRNIKCNNMCFSYYYNSLLYNFVNIFRFSKAGITYAYTYLTSEVQYLTSRNTQKN